MIESCHAPTTVIGAKEGDEMSASESESEWIKAHVNRAIAEAVPSRWRPEHVAVWHPPTDVYETDDSVVVVVEIAGLRQGDYELTLSNRTMEVRGRRRDPADKLAYYQMEIRYGEFLAQILLPWPLRDADQDVEATYEDGFLRVELRKAELRRVPVKHQDEDRSR
jgi:HSP20 family protein